MISLHAVFIVTEYHEFLYWCHCVYELQQTLSRIVMNVPKEKWNGRYELINLMNINSTFHRSSNDQFS